MKYIPMGGIYLDISHILKNIRELNLKALEFAGLTIMDLYAAFEREAIKNILVSTDGSVTAAALFLGMNKEKLTRDLKRLGINPNDYRKRK